MSRMSCVLGSLFSRALAISFVKLLQTLLPTDAALKSKQRGEAICFQTPQILLS